MGLPPREMDSGQAWRKKGQALDREEGESGPAALLNLPCNVMIGHIMTGMQCHSTQDNPRP